MPVVVGLIIIGLLVVVAHASAVMRVDAPVNPAGVAIIRRRWNFWMAKGKTWTFYVGCIVLGVILAVAFDRRSGAHSGPNVEVSAPASQSPDRAAVVSTMNDYFASLNTGSACRYAGAFSKSFRPPPMLADCKTRVSSTPEVQHITVGRNGTVSVRVTFASRRKADAGQPKDVCTEWTSDFRMIRKAGQLQIAAAPYSGSGQRNADPSSHQFVIKLLAAAAQATISVHADRLVRPSRTRS